MLAVAHKQPYKRIIPIQETHFLFFCFSHPKAIQTTNDEKQEEKQKTKQRPH